MAIKTVSTSAKWQGGTNTEIRIGPHVFQMDQPKEQGGTDLGPTPVQYFIASLAGCMSLVGRLVAAEMGFTFRSLEFITEGDIDPDGFSGKDASVKSGVQAIRMRIIADTDADEATLKRWLEVSKRRCPISDNLTAPLPTQFSVQAK